MCTQKLGQIHAEPTAKVIQCKVTWSDPITTHMHCLHLFVPYLCLKNLHNSTLKAKSAKTGIIMFWYQYMTHGCNMHAA